MSANNTVEELLSTPIPEEVWHYTTLAGLRGILSSNTIWATDVRFTNDKTEFIHCRDVAAHYLESMRTADPHFAFPVDDLLGLLNKAFDEGALSPLENEVYVASFSAAPDLLSQWTQYAEGSRGVSIAFDLRYVRPPRKLEIAVTCAPCVYDQREKELLIKVALGHFTDREAELDKRSRDNRWMADQVRTWRVLQRVLGLDFDQKALEEKLQGDFQKELLEAWRRSLFDLIRVASHCKDQSFSQEKEWRLALPIPKSRPPVHTKVKFRGTTGKISYLASNLFRNDGHLPITRIMTGPLCAETDEVRRILDANGYAVPVIGSSVPLRDPGSIT